MRISKEADIHLLMPTKIRKTYSTNHKNIKNATLWIRKFVFSHFSIYFSALFSTYR